MARYVAEFPMVDDQQTTFSQIQKYLCSNKFEYCLRDGEMVFQKGKGFWVAPAFVKVTYRGNTVKLEAWIDALGSEQGLDGFTGSAVKKPLKKKVAEIEKILTRPNPAYIPNEVETGDCEMPAEEAASPVKMWSPDLDLPTDRKITKKEYFQKYAGDSFRSNVKVIAIIGYIMCGIAAMTALVAPLTLIDAAIYLALVLGMHLGKSKPCVIGLLVLSAFSVIVNLVLTGTLAGWGWVIIGIYAAVVFSNAEKRYYKLIDEQ